MLSRYKQSLVCYIEPNTEPETGKNSQTKGWVDSGDIRIGDRLMPFLQSGC